MQLSDCVRKTKDIKVGGQMLTFSLLTLKDWLKINNSIKSKQKIQREQKRKELMADGKALKVENPLELLKLLQDPTMYVELNAENDFEIAALMFFLSLKPKYPDITQDKVEDIITPEDIEGVNDFLNQIPDKPTVSIGMDALAYKVKLQDGKTKTINDLIIDSQKKIRKVKSTKKT